MNENGNTYKDNINANRKDLFHTDLETILIIDHDILARNAVAEYLRDCGYRVIESATSDEALMILGEPDIQTDIVLSDVSVPGSLNGFSLSKWVRANKPGTDVILAGSLEQTADTAGALCDEISDAPKPYDHEKLVQHIRRLRGGGT